MADRVTGLSLRVLLEPTGVTERASATSARALHSLEAPARCTAVSLRALTEPLVPVRATSLALRVLYPYVPLLPPLPYMQIPEGISQKISELEGHSSISGMIVTTIDPGGELKTLAAQPGIRGTLAKLRLGFPAMDLGDFVAVHTLQLVTLGRTAEGLMRFELADVQRFLRDRVWTKGGPHAYQRGQQEIPSSPAGPAFAANSSDISDQNPRYLQGNPLDLLLVALQNEMGLGQASRDPATWQLYLPGDDATLINPNAHLDVDGVRVLRDGQFSGCWFQFKLTRAVSGKSWVDDQILKVLGLYFLVQSDGRLALKSMKSPENPQPVAVDQNAILGIPEYEFLPVVNVVTVRFEPADDERETAARQFEHEILFVDSASVATYKEKFPHTVEASGLRIGFGGWALAHLTADRILRRHGRATPQYTFQTHFSKLAIEVHDFISLSHPKMLDPLTGEVGVTAVLCQVVDKQPDYAAGTVRFSALDTRFMRLTTPYYIAPATLGIVDWSSASAEQKAKYMFVSYLSKGGCYSDGAPGHTIF